MFNRNAVIGMTLIELMFSLVLSVVILSSVFEIYLTAENNYRAQNTLMMLQENAQIVSQLLTQQIRMAGFMGCAKLSNGFPIHNNLSIKINADNKISNFNSKDIKPGTDGLMIWHASNKTTALEESMHETGFLYVESGGKFSVRDYLIISDCTTAEIIEIKKIIHLRNGVQKIIPTQAMGKLYLQHSTVNKLEQQQYFVGNTGRVGEDHQAIYALYTKENNDHKQELAEGIDGLKISYAMLENGKLVEHEINTIGSAENVIGISLDFTFSTTSLFTLHKKWYTYVALRE